MTRGQQFLLVALRTIIGWHFAYEGYFKLITPGWGPDGQPLSAWSSAAYLRGATGPLAGVFHSIATSPWVGAVDTVVAVSLVLIGLGLILGLFTQVACAGGIVLVALFYVSAIPVDGLPGPRLEGAYLLVNKNLIELTALAAVLAFKTGRIAGLDRWFASSRTSMPVPSTGVAA